MNKATVYKQSRRDRKSFHCRARFNNGSLRKIDAQVGDILQIEQVGEFKLLVTNKTAILRKLAKINQWKKKEHNYENYKI